MTLTGQWRLTSPVTAHADTVWASSDYHVPLKCDEEGALPLYYSSPKHTTLPKDEHVIRQTQIERILLNPWSVLFNTVKVIDNERRLRNCHGQQEPEERGGLTVMLYTAGDHGTENQWNLNKAYSWTVKSQCCCLVAMNGPRWCHMFVARETETRGRSGNARRYLCNFCVHLKWFQNENFSVTSDSF